MIKKSRVSGFFFLSSSLFSKSRATFYALYTIDTIYGIYFRLRKAMGEILYAFLKL